MLKKSWQSDKLLEDLSLKRVVLYNLYIAVSTIFFGIINFIPLLFFRFQATVKSYWISLLVLFLGFAFFSPVGLIVLFSAILSVEVFFLLERGKTSLFVNILASSILSTGFLYLNFFIFKDYEFISQLITQLEPLKQQFGKNLTPDMWAKLWLQLPSFIVISFSFILYFSLTYLSSFKSTNQVKEARQRGLSSVNCKTYLSSLRRRSLHFSVSAWLIWVFILSLVFSFVDMGLPEFFKGSGFNLLNICFAFYFLQGLGVVRGGLSLFKLNNITKKLIYILIFVYFFSFVSVLGFLDYWFDLKTKLKLYKLLKNKSS